jgi:uncharacterized protein YcfL
MMKRTAKIVVVSLATFMLVGCQADDAPKLAAKAPHATPLARRLEFSAPTQRAQIAPGSARHAGRRSPTR